MFRLRDTLSARFADLCYNGFWFSPEMDFILHAVNKSQEVRCEGYGCSGRVRAQAQTAQFALISETSLHIVALQRVSGSVDVQLYKGKASIVARSSPLSLYNPHVASMDAHGGWNPQDSTGFIKINAVRLKAHHRREAAIASGKVSA